MSDIKRFHGEIEISTTSIEQECYDVELARVESLLKKYSQHIKKIVETLYFREESALDGEYEGINYQATEFAGKQQPVLGIKFISPEGESFEVVCKNDGFNMHEKQKSDPFLQQQLPKIFLSLDQENDTQIQIIEKVNGIEQDKFFEAVVNSDKMFNQMVSEAVDIMDDTGKSNYELIDADFVHGRNVMYDKTSKKFRVFDIHAFRESEKDYNQKLIDFLNNLVIKQSRAGGRIDDLALDFLVKFIKRFVEKYPQANISCVGKIDTVLEIGTPEYQAAIDRANKGRGQRRIRFGAKFTSVKNNAAIQLNPEIVEACIAGDKKRLIDLLPNTSTPVTSLSS